MQMKMYVTQKNAFHLFNIADSLISSPAICGRLIYGPNGTQNLSLSLSICH